MPRRPSSDSISMGSFVNLKVTAEKLVKEQASVKTDLDMANSKLKNSLEHINALKEKLQTAINENAMLKVKQKEDAKIWNGLDSKLSSTKALCDQLTETLHYLTDQVHCAERDKKSFEDKFGASSSAFDGLNLQLTDLSGKLTSTEETMRKCEQELKELRLEKEEKENIYMDENSRITNRITEKGNVVQLYLTFDSWYKLVQQEKNLISKRVECQFDELHDWSLHITSENSAVRSDNEDLKNEVSKLQNLQEELMVQHAEECRLGEEKARTLESEAQTLVSEKEQLEMSMIKRQEIEHLPDTSIFSENKMKDLLVKFSTVEPENQDIQEKLHATLLGKESEVEILQKEISLHGQHADSLEKQLSKFCESEKEQLLLQLKENQLEDQRKEIQASLAAAETTLAETKMQYDLILESKQSELTKHLKEISQRNDQAINDIRRKFELEKLEIVNLEKAEKLVGDLERKGEQKLAESIEESRQYLMPVQQEHASLQIHEEVRDCYMIPQLTSDVMKPLQIEQLLDQKVVDISGSKWQRVAFFLCLGKTEEKNPLCFLGKPAGVRTHMWAGIYDVGAGAVPAAAGGSGDNAHGGEGNLGGGERNMGNNPNHNGNGDNGDDNGGGNIDRPQFTNLVVGGKALCYHCLEMYNLSRRFRIRQMEDHTRANHVAVCRGPIQVCHGCYNWFLRSGFNDHEQRCHHFWNSHWIML